MFLSATAVTFVTAVFFCRKNVGVYIVLVKKTKKKFVNQYNTKGRGSYRKIISQIIADGVCPFCPEHFSKYHTKKILRAGKYWLVTFNMNPYEGARWHFLFVHRTHIEKIESVSAPAWKELLTHIQWLVKKYKMPGASMFLRFGDSNRTGASVSHLHAQMIMGGPRRSGGSYITAAVGFS